MVFSIDTGRVLLCSSVSVVTRLWVWWTRNRGLVPSRGKGVFLLSANPHQLHGPHSHIFCGYQGGSFPRGKMAGVWNKLLQNFPGQFCGPASLLSDPCWEFISPGIKLPGCEAYHSPLSSVEVKKKWSSTSPPPYTVVCVQWHLGIRTYCLL